MLCLLLIDRKKLCIRIICQVKRTWIDSSYNGEQHIKRRYFIKNVSKSYGEKRETRAKNSSGQPKPCEGIWVDDMIIEKCLRSEKSLSRWPA